MATYGGGTSVKQAASGGYTLGAGEYAIVTYILSSTVNLTFSSSISATYGPGQTISSTKTIVVGANTWTYSLTSGVVFENLAP
ncbi:MAG: hypothetical protein BWZ03_00085 [bacterium ADurb.BinA186]|nr:MAG: hypothetical protein BWZ03_00085 [bacterium ADurb.BinA186]